jgi:DNA-binding NtrC family response regulator
MEYALILSRGQRIVADHLPHQVRTGRPRAVAGTIGPVATFAADNEKRTLRAIEMEHILRTLEKNKGHKPQTAQELGISLKTLYNKLNSLEEERRAAG